VNSLSNLNNLIFLLIYLHNNAHYFLCTILYTYNYDIPFLAAYRVLYEMLVWFDVEFEEEVD